MDRYLLNPIEQDLASKMVLLAGPRQVGKTTLALRLLNTTSYTHPAYLNWDTIAVRKLLLDGGFPTGQVRIVLDEIHKYKDWRNLIKGLYDVHKNETQFLVTGSARLDHYRKGGDSLQGRYHFYRMHPISLDEMQSSPKATDLTSLLTLGGFPEPLFAESKRSWNRWQKERRSRVFQEDLLSVENVREVSQIELLASLLPSRVGSPFSANAIREDLKSSHESVVRWITILENLYVAYRIYPWSDHRLKALRKEPKLYLWDWSLIPNEGARFENLVASHLLKYVHFKSDTEGEDWELHYLRDLEKREIDFIVTKELEPQFAVECKLGEKSLSPQIKYFSERTAIPQFYQVHTGEQDTIYRDQKSRILPFTAFASLFSCKQTSESPSCGKNA